MKKTGLISAFAIGLFTLMLCGCGPTSNNYDPWEGPIKGYITFDENGNFTGFIQGNNPGDQTNNSTCYIHEYDRNNPNGYISKQTMSNSSLDWEDDYGTREYIRFKKLNSIGQFSTTGLDYIYYYCDDNYLYLINNRGKIGDKETVYQGLANYRIFLDMNGLKDITIYMIDHDHVQNN